MKKCIQQATHYLDISNEFGILGEALRLNNLARQNRACIVPGVAFGVATVEYLANKVVDNQQADIIKVVIESPSGASTSGVAASVQQMMKMGPSLYDSGKFRTSTETDRWLKECAPPAPSGALETLGYTNLARRLAIHYTSTTTQHTTINIEATLSNGQANSLMSTFQETMSHSIILVRQAVILLLITRKHTGTLSPMTLIRTTHAEFQ